MDLMEHVLGAGGNGRRNALSRLSPLVPNASIKWCSILDHPFTPLLAEDNK